MCVSNVIVTGKVGPLVCGPCKLTERLHSMTGVIHKVYNNGEAALFQADNGVVFTIMPCDLAAEQPLLTVDEVLCALTRIFRTPLADNL